MRSPDRAAQHRGQLTAHSGRGAKPVISPALRDAQARLMTLRQQRAAANQATNPSSPHPTPQVSQLPARPPSHPTPAHLPSHLGWDSAPLSALHRRAQQERSSRLAAQAAANCTWLSPPPFTPSPPHPSSSPTPPKAVRVYPDLALAMLREGQASPGRIWLLLHAIDQEGRGWVTVAEARQRLTSKDSPLRVCGWRQLRNLLARGDGQFWQRQPCKRADAEDRIWLRSTAKVAAALGLRHLAARPVAVPLKDLCRRIGHVRAHLYATFHSSRTAATPPGASPAPSPSKPIARATLESLCGKSRHSQRAYEKRAGVHRQSNFAIGSRGSLRQEQELAWQHGRALFHFHDRRGKLGRPGATHLAWQLPNSYAGGHTHQPRGRQKRINRELADLFMQGITGNGVNLLETRRGASPGCTRPLHRRYYANGRLAGKQYNRSPALDLYWHNHTQAASRYQLWHALPAAVKDEATSRA